MPKVGTDWRTSPNDDDREDAASDDLAQSSRASAHVSCWARILRSSKIDAHWSRDATDGDGGCQCLAADSGWKIATTSLDCFLNGAQVAAYDYAVYAVDPCIGLRGSRFAYRSEQTYSAHNSIGVDTSGGDGPRYEYFYDATTKALVGATRISWWTGDDPLNCNGATGREVTVRAGIFPECEGGTCIVTNSRTLCFPSDSGID